MSTGIRVSSGPICITGWKLYLAGYWSVTVKANWRIIFRFDGEDVHDVELLDYH